MHADRSPQEGAAGMVEDENGEELGYEEDKGLYQHGYRKEAIAQAPTAVGATQGRVGQDREATQRYLDKAPKEVDLTYDFDCREERPETAEAIQEIQNALQQTYSDFASHTNVPLQMPNSRDSYLDQWNCMQVQLNTIWTTDRTKKIEPPQLFVLGKWTVSFENWVSVPQAYLSYALK